MHVGANFEAVVGKGDHNDTVYSKDLFFQFF